LRHRPGLPIGRDATGTKQQKTCNIERAEQGIVTLIGVNYKHTLLLKALQTVFYRTDPSNPIIRLSPYRAEPRTAMRRAASDTPMSDVIEVIESPMVFYRH
jgi:hypothetical protein